MPKRAKEKVDLAPVKVFLFALLFGLLLATDNIFEEDSLSVGLSMSGEEALTFMNLFSRRVFGFIGGLKWANILH